MNSTQRPTLTLEVFLYGLIALAALALRLLNLGAHPLNDVEAQQALAVLAQVRGLADPTLGPHSPGYFFLTFFSFLLFGASEATARLGPALAGTGLVLAPALFREPLGRGGALVASGLLAIAATLLAASRSADGTVIAVLGLSLAVGAVLRAQALHRAESSGAGFWLYVAALALGLGLASGGTFWFGALALALTVLGMRWTQPATRAWLAETWHWIRAQRRVFPLTVVLSVLVVSTVGFTFLHGLGLLVDSVVAWLGGFLPSSAGRLPALLLIFLVAYEPLVVALGIAGAIRAFRGGHVMGQAITWFSVIALAELVLYSGRGLPDLVWVVAPLTLLAGWALYGMLEEFWAPSEVPLAAAQAALTGALAVFALLSIASYAEVVKNGGTDLADYAVSLFGQPLSISPVAQLAVAVLAVVLIFVIAYLVALGWSGQAARLGLLLAGTGLLLSMSVSAGWGLTQLRPGSPAELWWETPSADDVQRMMQTLSSVSNFSVGNPHDVQVTVQAPRTGLMAWALRDFPHAAFVDRLDPVINSPVVITPSDEKNPTLGSSYVGQRFDVRAVWTPDLSLPEWIDWAAYRRAPAQTAEMVIVWVRNDVQQLKSANTP